MDAYPILCDLANATNVNAVQVAALLVTTSQSDECDVVRNGRKCHRAPKQIVITNVEPDFKVAFMVFCGECSIGRSRCRKMTGQKLVGETQLPIAFTVDEVAKGLRQLTAVYLAENLNVRAIDEATLLRWSYDKKEGPWDINPAHFEWASDEHYRRAVNMARHQLSDYENFLGNDDVFRPDARVKIIRQAIYTLIAGMYPCLESECRRQATARGLYENENEEEKTA